MNVARLLVVGTWLQLKMRSRSAFDGLLAIIYPLFFATTVFLMFREGRPAALVGAAIGASAMGVWSAVSTTASTALQSERRQGTLELLVASPTAFPLIVVPITVSMAITGLWSLVATLLWGRWVFGIDVRIDTPSASPVPRWRPHCPSPSSATSWPSPRSGIALSGPSARHSSSPCG
jgi:ABC-2 type transport system permease protein